MDQFDARTIWSKLLWLLTRKKSTIENKRYFRQIIFKEDLIKFSSKKKTITLWNQFIYDFFWGSIPFLKNNAILVILTNFHFCKKVINFVMAFSSFSNRRQCRSPGDFPGKFDIFSGSYFWRNNQIQILL